MSVEFKPAAPRRESILPPRRAGIVLVAHPTAMIPIILRGDSPRGPTVLVPEKVFEAVVRALPDLIRGACRAAE